MEKKKIYYIIGAIAIVGIGYYLWNKNKSQVKNTEEDSEDDKEETTSKSSLKKPYVLKGKLKGAVEGVKSEESVKKLTAQELESKLQSACGKKPRLKKNKRKYEQCRANYTVKLKSQGLVAFDGTYEGVVSDSFYSSFENNWDLDL